MGKNSASTATARRGGKPRPAKARTLPNRKYASASDRDFADWVPPAKRRHVAIGPSRFAAKSQKTQPRRDRAAPRNKISIALAPEDVTWAQATADLLGISVSKLFSESLAIYKRRHNLGKLIEELWPEATPLTDAERKELDDEIRNAIRTQGVRR